MTEKDKLKNWLDHYKDDKIRDFSDKFKIPANAPDPVFLLKGQWYHEVVTELITHGWEVQDNYQAEYLFIREGATLVKPGIGMTKISYITIFGEYYTLLIHKMEIPF